MTLTFNNKEIDINQKKTYRENVTIKFDGVALLLKLNRKRKDKENKYNNIRL